MLTAAGGPSRRKPKSWQAQFPAIRSSKPSPLPVWATRPALLEALERMAALGPVRLGRDLTYPEFALVRGGDPRVKALRKKVGLPE